MTFAELYGDRLDEELGVADSTRLFTTARRKQAINNGLRQFADLTEAYTRESSITCSNGQGEYNVLSTALIAAGDFVRLSKQLPEYRRVSSGAATSASTVYASGKDFRRTTVQWLDQYEPGWRQSTGGTPQFYYERMDGGRRFIGLYPPPRLTSSQAGTLRLPYVARPSSMTDDTHVPFSRATGSSGIRTDLVEYHEALAHYGAYRLEKLRLQTQESGQQLQVFLGYVQRFLTSLRPKGGTTVKVARSYFGEVRERRGGEGGLKPWPTDKWGDR